MPILQCRTAAFYPCLINEQCLINAQHSVGFQQYLCCWETVFYCVVMFFFFSNFHLLLSTQGVGQQGRRDVTLSRIYSGGLALDLTLCEHTLACRVAGSEALFPLFVLQILRAELELILHAWNIFFTCVIPYSSSICTLSWDEKFELWWAVIFQLHRSDLSELCNVRKFGFS